VNLQRYLEERSQLVDRALIRYLPEQEESPSTLNQAMRYGLFSGGKRIRPILALASGEAVGAPIARVMPFACALEMIHSYSLIHDDLPAMDNDDLRRGKPTNHIVFGEGMAILAGDGLLTEAFRVMADAALRRGQDQSAALRALREITIGAGAIGMVGGQVADLEAENKKPTRALVEYIHVRKTAALIRAAVRAGALVGGAQPKQFTRLNRYGGSIGLAFQIADDILDVEGSTDRTGKREGRDAELRKVTYPTAVGMAKAKARAQELLDEALHAIKPFGSSAEPLRQIALFIVSRVVRSAA